MSGDSIPTETVTRKPDEDVGKPGGPAAGGGKQTPQQAAITQQGGGGRSEAEEHASWSQAGGEPGRDPTPIGGSSNGQSDRKAAGGPDEGKSVAAGHYKVEKQQAGE